MNSILATVNEQVRRYREEKRLQQLRAQEPELDGFVSAVPVFTDVIDAEEVGNGIAVEPNPGLSSSGTSHERIGAVAPTPCANDNLTAKTDRSNPKDLIGDTKPDLSLVPSALAIHVAGVMALGARKYGKRNWTLHKVRYSVYIAAALRHLAQANDGEDIDPESGEPHLAHAAACCGILLDAAACDSIIDDRGPAGPASALLKRLTKKV